MADLAELSVQLQHRLEAEYTAEFADVLSSAMDELLPQLRSGAYPVLPAALRRAVTVGLTAIWRSSIDLQADIFLSAFNKADQSLDRKANRDDEIARALNAYIDNYGARSAAQIIRTTERQVRDLILGGLRRGEAQEAVFSDFVNKIPQIAEQRAELITRTEVHGASQYASQRLAQRAQIGLKKLWTSVNDERTRSPLTGSHFNHRVMDGTVQAVDLPFAVPTLMGGVEPLLFPGDPNGSAGNIINCRCVQTYVRTD